MTQDQVADAMDWSLSKIIRIETGAVGISTNDLRALLGLYKIHGPDRVHVLVELARASRQPSWLSKYRGGISAQYVQYIEYEQAASVVRNYEPLLIPGLLQTKEYAEAVIRELADPSTPAETIQNRIKVRLTRQRLLEQTVPPAVTCVLDESGISPMSYQISREIPMLRPVLKIVSAGTFI